MKTKFLTTMGVLAVLAAKPVAAALPADSVAEEPAHRATIHVHGLLIPGFYGLILLCLVHDGIV